MNAQIELQHADWRDGMMAWSGANFDSLITDPPYSERTAKGFHTGTAKGLRSEPIAYGWIDEAYCRDFMTFWLPRVRHWLIIFGDHVTCSWWLQAMGDAGLYTFPPVPWVKEGSQPRFMGDGPSSQCEWLAVGRQRVNTPNKRFRPGYYVTPQVKSEAVDGGKIVTGQKPVELLRAIIRDYSERSDRLVEPHAGSGSTLVAARLEGRSCLGFERDAATYAKAQARLSKSYTPDMFAEVQ